MGYFINEKSGFYYEGHRMDISDKAVSKRPSSDYKYKKNNWIIDTSKLKENVKLRCNELLNKTDWITIRQLEKNTLSDVNYKKFLKYRQALRDLPNKIDLTKIKSIDDVTFPSF